MWLASVGFMGAEPNLLMLSDVMKSSQAADNKEWYSPLSSEGGI
ncbi:hypothetical protein [Brenneria roseae]|nr:hypothetical protein [Brenneria roseae]